MATAYSPPFKLFLGSNLILCIKFEQSTSSRMCERAIFKILLLHTPIGTLRIKEEKSRMHIFIKMLWVVPQDRLHNLSHLPSRAVL